MEIEDKYLSLLNLYIYDKRTKEDGMLASIEINKFFNGYGISYRAFYSKFYENIVFVEDFEKGNVVFLIPFALNYETKLLEDMAKRAKDTIKKFFGDKYRDDMIMEISEDDRQRQIKWWENLTLGLDNWHNKFNFDKINNEPPKNNN